MYLALLNVERSNLCAEVLFEKVNKPPEH